MYESLFSFPGSLFAELDRLRRDFDDGTDTSPASIRSVAPGAFPAINIGHTPQSMEVYAFAPGIDASKVEVVVDRGVLTIAGERTPATPGDKARSYSRERAGGRFQRAVSLPDDADPSQVGATYRDGVLHISIARRAAPQPTRIAVQ